MNLINVRLILLKNKDGSKWIKLTSIRLSHIPRKGELVCIMQRDFTVEDVAHDLEMYPKDPEVVVSLREIIK